MAAVINNICVDFITLLNNADGSRESGLTVALLQEGGTDPGDLIALTEAESIPGRYNFNGSVVSGRYTVYVGGLPVVIDSITQDIYVSRNVPFRGAMIENDTLPLSKMDSVVISESGLNPNLGFAIYPMGSYGFTNPLAVLVPKSGWGAYISAINSSNLTVTFDSMGVGETVAYDLIVYEN